MKATLHLVKKWKFSFTEITKPSFLTE